MNLPKQYAWLAAEPGPRILVEMVKLYGTVETPGPENNPLILSWAKSLGLDHVYKDDSEQPWCGLCVAYAAQQAGWDVPLNPLWARNWLKWGTVVPLGEEMLGDVLIFARGSAGHVAEYAGETKTAFTIIGGNQSDGVNIKSKAKSQLLGARRCPWRVNQPGGVRKIMLAANGQISRNEA